MHLDDVCAQRPAVKRNLEFAYKRAIRLAYEAVGVFKQEVKIGGVYRVERKPSKRAVYIAWFNRIGVESATNRLNELDTTETMFICRGNGRGRLLRRYTSGTSEQIGEPLPIWHLRVTRKLRIQ